MTAKGREETYELLHERTALEVKHLKDLISANDQGYLLKFTEADADKTAQLELDQLTQDAIENLKAELGRSHGRLGEDFEAVRTFVVRAVDSLGDSFHGLRRASEEARATAQKKSQLSLQIESDVMKAAVSSLEGQISRELGTVKLDVRSSLAEMERNAVHQQSAVQQIEKKLHEQQRQMFEMEKAQAKTSGVFPGGEVHGAGGAGGGGEHRISVMDFTLKGVVGRLNNLERDSAARDDKLLALFRAETAKMEDRAKVITAEMKAAVEEGKKGMGEIVAAAKVTVGRIASDLETSGRADADSRNGEALRAARKALEQVEEMGAWTKKTVDMMEGRVGRVRIDFDRMVGDTTATCAALADGLAGVRTEVKGGRNGGGGSGEEERYGRGRRERRGEDVYEPHYEPHYGTGAYR